jgi:hypothetical protein
MASDVFRFLWIIPESGYKWIQARVYENEGGAAPGKLRHNSRLEERHQWVLTDGLAIGQTYFRKVYDPLKAHAGLFRTFAQLAPDNRDAILAFANQYGNLGIYRPLDLTAPDEPQRLLGVWGETHHDWAKQIDEMQRAVRIWDMLQARDVAGLSRYISWQEGGERILRPDLFPVQVEQGWVYDSHPDLPPFPVDPLRASPPPPGRSSQMIQPVEDLFKPGDVLTPAMFLVQRWINDHLKERVSPRLLYHLEFGTQVLQIVPNNLLGAMWLQFAHTIAGNKKHRPCKECGKWIEISSEEDGRSARRMFCSDPCKFRDYRRRKERAQLLKAEGKPIKVIATELDTDVETIKKWVTKRKG